jgi:hypothetical protein
MKFDMVRLKFLIKIYDLLSIGYGIIHIIKGIFLVPMPYFKKPQ